MMSPSGILWTLLLGVLSSVVANLLTPVVRFVWRSVRAKCAASRPCAFLLNPSPMAAKEIAADVIIGVSLAPFLSGALCALIFFALDLVKGFGVSQPSADDIGLWAFGAAAIHRGQRGESRH